MRDILTVTTSTLMGSYEVEEYYGYISVNFVTGANFLRDWLAGWTDILGGVSKSYTRELDELKSMARSALENKVRLLGMNCILGLQIDIDPIFGSNYSMFMVSATGTACKINNLMKNNEGIDPVEFNIKLDLSRIYAVNSLSNTPINLANSTLDEIEEFIVSFPKDNEIMLVDFFLKNFKENPTKYISFAYKSNINIISEFLYKNNYLKIAKYVSDNITKEKTLFIKNFNIIDYSSILEQLKNVNNSDTELDLLVALSAEPQIVTKENYYALKELLELIHKKYNDKVDIKTSGLGKKKESWICKHCKCSVDISRQSCHSCNYDRLGLPTRITRYVGGDGQVFNFSKRIEHLESIYSTLSKYY